MSIVAVVCYPGKMVDRSINQLFDSDDLHTLHMIHAEDIPDIDKAISDINEEKARLAIMPEPFPGKKRSWSRFPHARPGEYLFVCRLNLEHEPLELDLYVITPQGYSYAPLTDRTVMESAAPGCAYLASGITSEFLDWLTQRQICHLTGRCIHQGSCVLREAEFNMDKVAHFEHVDDSEVALALALGYPMAPKKPEYFYDFLGGLEHGSTST